MRVLGNRTFWIGAIAGVVLYTFVWPRVSGLMSRGTGSSN